MLGGGSPGNLYEMGGEEREAAPLRRESASFSLLHLALPPWEQRGRARNKSHYELALFRKGTSISESHPGLSGPSPFLSLRKELQEDMNSEVKTGLIWKF